MSFSLRDHLFNPTTITQLAHELTQARADFAEQDFIRDVLAPFPTLELKARITHITTCLHRFLPADYEQAIVIILRALPVPLDPMKEDDDFGSFIHASYGEYISTYGCQKHLLHQSFAALEQITMRFSVEFAIRQFCRQFPEETYAQMQVRATHPNYHVRRLVSEGSRPMLPRGTKIQRSREWSVTLVSKLRNDPTSYVRRSVANHLHDRSKTRLGDVIALLRSRRESGQLDLLLMEKLIRHTLRTAIKQGKSDALALIGHHEPALADCRLEILTPQVSEGEKAMFTFHATSKQEQELLFTSVVHFPSVSGRSRTKIFQLGKGKFAIGQNISLIGSLRMQSFTTRKLVPGMHHVTVCCHGQELVKDEWIVI